MATTQNTYTGDNSTTLFSFTFPYLEESDVKVSLDGVDKTQTTDYTFANATQISFNTAPGTGVAIRIYRETNIDAAQATFFAGSSIRSQDLNDNNNQLLYSTQETVNRRLDRTGGTLTGDLVMDNADIVFEGATADAFETTLTVVDPTADRTITLPNVTGTVVTTGDTGTVATAMIAADAVNGTKIADDSINSEHYVDASIDTQHIADAQITTAKIAADAVTNAKIADDSIDSEHYVDGSIDTAHIADLQVTTAKIAADAVTNAKIADDSIDSEHYVDGSIDTAHIADSQVTTAKIADANVTTAKITDANVTTAKLADSSVTTAKIADANVTAAKLADASVTNAKLADAELQELATMGGLTAAALADLTQAEVQILDGATVTTAELNLIDGLTANAADLNQLDTNTLTNSPTWTSTSQYPSAASIDSRITARIDPLGGFEAIADEDSFPATAPPEGTVVSIANANGLAVNASGVGAGTRAGGSDAVVINGFPSGFNSTSLDDGIGLLVVATSTAHTYDFHRVVAKDEDVRQLSSDINDFKARYRVGSTNPTTDLDSGDLFFNTGTGKMLVYDGTSSAWEEVQSIGEFFINTLSSSSGTGGGSATFNGTAYRFTLSNAPTFAQQLIVSINGVIQEPNSGTAQPTDGFAIDGSDIIFAAAPASGSDFFIITMGSTVNIGTPSAGTVGTTQLADGGVTTAKIADDAVTAAKLADTAVTAASYTFANITVDAQGRITAASSGIVPAQDAITEGNTHVEVFDTGSNGEVRLTTDGTRAVTVDSSQRVGIGVTDPAEELEVSGSGGCRIALNRSGNDGYGYIGTGTTNDLQFGRDGSGSLEYGRFDSSGRLLVGTSSWSGGYTGQVIEGNSAAGDGPGVLYLARGAESPTDGQYLGEFNFSNTTGDKGASIISMADGAWATNDYPGRLVFSTTADGASSPTERLRIAQSGAFGLSGANYGTSGQVLTSQGSGSAPQWATVASGGSVSGTPSGTSWSVTGITGSPDLITVSVYGYTNNVSNEWLALQLRNSSGPISSGSYSSTVRQNGGSAVLNANTIYWVLLDQSHTNSSTAVLNGNITLARSATNQWTASWILYQENSSGSVTTGAGRFTATTGGSITGIQILSGSNHNGTFSATF